jgi:hypothetical protein
MAFRTFQSFELNETYSRKLETIEHFIDHKYTYYARSQLYTWYCAGNLLTWRHESCQEPSPAKASQVNLL